jgi:hypothetical protein
MDASSDESLQTFMAITGASIQEARHFVEMAQGDLDAAVGFFLLGHEKQPEQPRAAIAPHRSMLTDAVFEDDLLAPANPFASTQNRALANEHDDRLARIFSPPYNLMYTGHFEAARLDAQQTDKWIMVTIHNPAEFECQKMNRDLWSDERITKLTCYRCCRSHQRFVHFLSIPNGKCRRSTTFHICNFNFKISIRSEISFLTYV